MRHPRRRTLMKLAAATVLATTGTACSPSGRPAGGAGSAPPPPGGTPVAVSLPPPTGPWPVGTVDLHLVDRTRPDPLVPSKPFRELMIGVWYPADRRGTSPVAPWLLPGAAADWDAHSAPGMTVPAGAVDWRGIRTHARTGAPAARSAGRLPVVLFSSGDGGTRALGTTVVEELASRGYVVVTLDSPYEADQVEFPGGRVERAVPLPDDLTPEVIAELLEKHARARVADARFVLRRIEALAAGRNPDAGGRPLPAGLPEVLDTSRTGMFGQSLGGSVAAQLAHDDPRVRAAANLDGELVGPVAHTGVTGPYLLMVSDGKPPAAEPGGSTPRPGSPGPRITLLLRDARHGSYTDLQVVLPQVTAHLPVPAAPELIGTVDPRRSLAAQRAALTAFFDLHLKHRPTTLFEDPGARFPELRIVNRADGGRSSRTPSAPA
ncbi:alpha/beta hydrolase family protein [Streptomyces sp. E-08]|uniref:alpha/beta hydrolase family protein n=1 Tax=Streptomyces sp. E-08 TaxID=3404047 RepID=UPI003CF3510E